MLQNAIKYYKILARMALSYSFSFENSCSPSMTMTKFSICCISCSSPSALGGRAGAGRCHLMKSHDARCNTDATCNRSDKGGGVATAIARRMAVDAREISKAHLAFAERA